LSLRDAAAAVEHDLHGRYAAELAAALPARQWWLEQWPAGGEHLAGLLAQDVQEAVHHRHDPLWPLCPTCRDHALFVEPDLGPDPFWVCHRTGLPVAQVGCLPD
jgi:hypothetical protein